MRTNLQNRVLEWMKVLQEEGLGQCVLSARSEQRDLFLLNSRLNRPGPLVRESLPARSDNRFIRSGFGKSSGDGLLICKPSRSLWNHLPELVRERCRKEQLNKKGGVEVAWGSLDGRLIDEIFNAILVQAGKNRRSSVGQTEKVIPDNRPDSPSRIRFLPLGDVEFSNEAEVKTFLETDLPQRIPCHFEYREHSIEPADDTWVLFQYHGKVFGFGLILTKQKQPSPDGLYKGFYQFAPDSIRLFSEPLSSDDMAQICGCEIRLGQSFNPVPIESIDKLLERIQDKREFIQPPDPREGSFLEGGVLPTSGTAYVRNQQARDACVRKLGFRCGICQMSFDEIYGEIGKGFIHVHHRKPLSERKGSYQVDPATDLQPVCANCHAMLHRRNPPYSEEELLKIMREARSSD